MTKKNQKVKFVKPTTRTGAGHFEPVNEAELSGDELDAVDEALKDDWLEDYEGAVQGTDKER